MKEAIFAIALLAMAPAYAQLCSQSFGVSAGEITDTELDVAESSFANPGMMPDNPLYMFKRFGENVRLVMTFDENARARLHAEFARTRLAELKRLVEDNKTLTERHVAEFENEITALNSTNDSGVREMLGKSRIVLAMVANQAPEDARPAIERALERSFGKSGALSSNLQELLAARERNAGRMPEIG